MISIGLVAPTMSYKMDCTLELRVFRWAHFAGRGLQSETEAILA
jgi:hypothetical protein